VLESLLRVITCVCVCVCVCAESNFKKMIEDMSETQQWDMRKWKKTIEVPLPPSLLHCSTTPLLHYSTTPLLRYTTTPLLHYTTTPLHHCSTTPLPHYSTAPLHHCSTAPLSVHFMHSCLPPLTCACMFVRVQEQVNSWAMYVPGVSGSVSFIVMNRAPLPISYSLTRSFYVSCGYVCAGASHEDERDPEGLGGHA
jgi:hypothetical protein